jgi:hypothetical protein
MLRTLATLTILMAAPALHAQPLFPPDPHDLETVVDRPGLTPRALDPERARGHTLVLNGDVSSTLDGVTGKSELAGRVSMHLEAPERARSGGDFIVKGFTLLYRDVPQEAVLGARAARRRGPVGFSIDPFRGEQRLRYDPRTGTLEGILSGQIDAQHDADSAPIPDARGDAFRTPTIDSTITIRMQLEGTPSFADTADASQAFAAHLDLDLHGARGQLEDRPPIAVTGRKIPLRVEIGPLFFFEVARRLCIQPVRIIRFKPPPFFRFDVTGAGLEFGEPGLRTQWAKADVVFEIRNFINLFKPKYYTLAQDEASSLRSEVNVDDCVEVFFVHSLSPHDMWGGGATWGLGTAGSKVISSDGNARNGVDFTHLAHEIGHVLGLCHPGDGDCTENEQSSTGTLMCPSGWNNDNPPINSGQNEDNAHNPLLTFSFKRITAGPDCEDSAACGACS